MSDPGLAPGACAVFTESDQRKVLRTLLRSIVSDWLPFAREGSCLLVAK